jgi:hypothetical protein
VDGFVALRGGADGGQVTTKPLGFKGQKLLLNYVVNPGGGLTIDALDESGKVVGQSQPLEGDAVDAPVTWKQNPDLSNGMIRLRFSIRNADVYSLRFE